MPAVNINLLGSTLYTYEPKPDITTHELALIMKTLALAVYFYPGREDTAVFTEKQYDGLGTQCKRHFKRIAR